MTEKVGGTVEVEVLRERNKTLEREVNPRSIVLATTTLYQNWYQGEARSVVDTDKIRGDLALRFVQSAIDRGYQVVIADGESAKEFKDALAKLNIVILPRATPQRAAGRREVFEKAAQLDGVKAIVYTQPEKASLVEDCTGLIAEPIVRGEADIVIPRRNELLFKETYPDYYHTIENDDNRWYNKMLHLAHLLPEDQNFDIFFGSFAFRNDPSLLALFLKRYEYVGPRVTGTRNYIMPEEASNAHMFPIVEALKNGLRVISIEVPFRYAEEQKANEESEGLRNEYMAKRREQRYRFLAEEKQMLLYLLGMPRSRLRLAV